MLGLVIGGCSDTSVTDGVVPSGGTGTAPGGSGGTTPLVPVGAVLLSVTPTTINALETATVTATVTDTATPPANIADGTTVTFTINNTQLGSITSTSTTVSGVATATFTALGLSGTASVSVTAGSVTSTGSILINGPGAIALAVTPVPVPPATVSTISALGTATVAATVTDLSSPAVNVPDGTVVTFTVNSATLGSITPTATTVSGVATATFTALNQPGTVTATATAGNATASTTFDIAGVDVGSIEFVSALPNVIGVQGSGQTEQATITFLVKDLNGSIIVDGTSVTFGLDGPKGGELLTASLCGTAICASTVNGLAKVTLQSGSVAGPVRVTATTTIAGPPSTTIATTSTGVSIGGGVPSATHFDLAGSILRLAGFTKLNLQSTITAFLADRFGNFNVLTGTTVTFFAEGGAIDTSEVTDNTGLAAVQFRTQAPDPLDVPATTAISPDTVSEYDNSALEPSWTGAIPCTFVICNPRDGWSTLLATTIGEEAFTDANGNGLYDAGEPFVDLGEPFIDRNDNDIFDVGELFIDFDSDGNYTVPDGIWNAQTMIWTDLKITIVSAHPHFGPSTTRFQPNTPFNIANGGAASFTVFVSDFNMNLLPPGSTIAISADAGKLAGGGTFVLADGLSTGPVSFGIALADADPNTVKQEAVTITVDIISKIDATDSILATLLLTGTMDFGPVITTASLPGGTIGSAYIASVKAAGGNLPYNWTSSPLPAGFILDATTGTITAPATATAAAIDTIIQLTVTDASTPPVFDSKSFILKVE